MKLGVNVDHVATLREARGTRFPDPVVAAMLAEYAGAHSIVAHLREDRRHIKERDLELLRAATTIPLNLEMSTNNNIVEFAVGIRPHQATLVPERRKELTTEGGLNLLERPQKVERVVKRLQENSIRVSLFVDPSKRQIQRAQKIGVGIVELNTGRYSETSRTKARKLEVAKIREAAKYAKDIGLFVAAGHGLDYENVKEIARIEEIAELNIGHSIVCHSVFLGMVSAVEEMLSLITG
ncbi:MAG: pyridoxine 5'-phosphate synthase [Candidatus Omnitrophota bacterium]|nr:MAG: pyridoxine 5'-phosphate synthase [Candidatus Omnitrophota bacterium]